MKNIRNFCIIAHIDHGKSTLADRLLEMTNTISERDMHARGIGRYGSRAGEGDYDQEPCDPQINYSHRKGENYILNLIDTPGHVDFSYEVSRALAACEGALPARGCHPGHPGANDIEPLPGHRERPGDHPCHQQDRYGRRHGRRGQRPDHRTHRLQAGRYPAGERPQRHRRSGDN